MFLKIIKKELLLTTYLSGFYYKKHNKKTSRQYMYFENMQFYMKYIEEIGSV